MLRREVEVARLAQARARAGILTKDLVLRGGWQPGGERRRNTHAEERAVSIVPMMVDSSRPQARLFHDREVTAKPPERKVRSRKRGDKGIDDLLVWSDGGEAEGTTRDSIDG